jgi:hypothetical protein
MTTPLDSSLTFIAPGPFALSVGRPRVPRPAGTDLPALSEVTPEEACDPFAALLEAVRVRDPRLNNPYITTPQEDHLTETLNLARWKVQPDRCLAALRWVRESQTVRDMFRAGTDIGAMFEDYKPPILHLLTRTPLTPGACERLLARVCAPHPHPMGLMLRSGWWLALFHPMPWHLMCSELPEAVCALDEDTALVCMTLLAETTQELDGLRQGAEVLDTIMTLGLEDFDDTSTNANTLSAPLTNTDTNGEDQP